MTSLLDKLNLRPQERRVVVLGAAAVFVVLNFFFVWPHIDDFSRVNRQIAEARRTLANYQQEIARTADYQSHLDKLQRLGSAVLPSEQAVQLLHTVQDQARLSDVLITSTRTQPTGVSGASTNQFFDEQTVAIDVNTGDKELVNFLIALGSGDSMIRVRDLDLRPDPPLYKLLGKLTLVASYQKKPKTVTPAAAPRPAAANARTNGTTTARTNAITVRSNAITARPHLTNPVTFNRTNKLKS
jgi:Tfp pilus assembly protein PilO